MRILKRKEFIQMPIGTVFSYYQPCVFHDLMIKESDGKEWVNDFLYDGIIGAIENKSSEDFSDKCDKMESGESVPMDFEYTGREGMFDDDQLFAVYEKVDIEKLIERLQKTL